MEKRIKPGRRRKGIVGDGEAISKCAKSSLKLGQGKPGGWHQELSLGSMTRSWRDLRSLEEIMSTNRALGEC